MGPLLALGISAAPTFFSGINRLFGGGGPSENEKYLRNLFMGQIGQPFEKSQQYQILQQLIGQQQNLAKEQTANVLGDVGRSVSGRGYLSPPGEGRGVLGALQVRAAVPIQRQLQQNISGLQAFSQQDYINRQNQLIQLLLQLEDQTPGTMEDIMAALKGGGNLFSALTPFIKK